MGIAESYRNLLAFPPCGVSDCLPLRHGHRMPRQLAQESLFSLRLNWPPISSHWRRFPAGRNRCGPRQRAVSVAIRSHWSRDRVSVGVAVCQTFCDLALKRRFQRWESNPRLKRGSKLGRLHSWAVSLFGRIWPQNSLQLLRVCIQSARQIAVSETFLTKPQGHAQAVPARAIGVAELVPAPRFPTNQARDTAFVSRAGLRPMECRWAWRRLPGTPDLVFRLPKIMIAFGIKKDEI